MSNRFLKTLAFVVAGLLMVSTVDVQGQVTEKQEPKAEKKSDSDQEKEKQTSKTETADKKTDISKSSDAASTDKEKKVVKTVLRPVEFGGRRLDFETPATWTAKKPRINFIKHELQVTKVKNDTENGRLTFSVASGSAKSNVQRWFGQFVQPDGSETSKQAKQKVETINGLKVTIVDISGTYLQSSGGPMMRGKVTKRKKYRMLAAIIGDPEATDRTAKCFIKLVGPQKTVEENAKAFVKMAKTFKVTE